MIDEPDFDADTWREQLRQAGIAVTSHPAFIEQLLCEALRTTLMEVFVPNWNDLCKLLHAPSRNPGLALELMQNVHAPDIRERFHGMVVRALHNYVASTMTLVEHSRQIMSGRTGEVVDAFAIEKERTNAHGEMRFVQDLRNFMLHGRLPFVAFNVTFSELNTPGQKLEAEVELDVRDLLRSDKWTAQSRSFIEAYGTALPLRLVVLRHGGLVRALNAWLHNALSDRIDYEALNELGIRRNAILMGVDVETARQATLAEPAARQRPPQKPSPLRPSEPST